MKNQNRHILLLIDNAPCHRIDEELRLTNVTIQPSTRKYNSSSSTIDAGIIYSFKVQTIYALRLVLNLSFINLSTYFQAKYRQLLCENRIQEFDKEIETGVSPSKLSILDAIQMTATAWDKVTTNTQ